ncbi:hypothetical protein CEXT_72371 [Caerostris extrusa]|uniref:Uncharacterized protein n=1 Tax=Caerostris extrusa TaxID=172846 RepID=A0AAV4M7A4_CAEEX|nr:hypothetical protein CEXT_72371 [Caerostris extrusa]
MENNNSIREYTVSNRIMIAASPNPPFPHSERTRNPPTSLAVRKEFRRTRLETKERVVGAECGIDAELLQGLYINTCRVAVLTPQLTSPTPSLPLYVRTKTLSIFPLNRP